jgi:hypothetical protein
MVEFDKNQSKVDNILKVPMNKASSQITRNVRISSNP